MLFASELAACLGKNPYCSQDEIAMKLLKREAPTIYAEKLLQNGEEIFDALPESEKKTLADGIGQTDTATSVLENTKKAMQALDALEIDTDKKEKLRKHVRSVHATDFGERKEDVTKKVSENRGDNIRKDNKFVKRILRNVNGIDVLVGGRCDGITSNGDIIEIKNRVKGFRGLTEYEKIQLLAYMYIIGSNNGTLVESYNGETREYHIEWDKSEWDSLIDNLNKFIELYMEYLV